MTAQNRHFVKCDDCLDDGGWWQGQPHTASRIYVACPTCAPLRQAIVDAAVAWCDTTALCSCENTVEEQALIDAVTALYPTIVQSPAAGNPHSVESEWKAWAVHRSRPRRHVLNTRWYVGQTIDGEDVALFATFDREADARLVAHALNALDQSPAVADRLAAADGGEARAGEPPTVPEAPSPPTSQEGSQ